MLPHQQLQQPPEAGIPAGPMVRLQVSRAFNLLCLLESARRRPSTGELPQLEAGLRRLHELRTYSPGGGLWGFFEEAVAGCDDIDELAGSLGRACTQLQETMIEVMTQALPRYKEELDRRCRHLEQRRGELLALWRKGESRLMEVIATTFGATWQGCDAEHLDLHLVQDEHLTARSRPLLIVVNDQPTELLLGDMVHELLHRSSFGAVPGSLWAKLELYYFSAGVPERLGHEITHAVITVAGCAITAEVWGLDEALLYQSFYEGSVTPQPASLEVMARLWPAYSAGELRLPVFLKRAVTEIGAALAFDLEAR